MRQPQLPLPSLSTKQAKHLLLLRLCAETQFRLPKMQHILLAGIETVFSK